MRQVPLAVVAVVVVVAEVVPAPVCYNCTHLVAGMAYIPAAGNLDCSVVHMDWCDVHCRTGDIENYSMVVVVVGVAV